MVGRNAGRKIREGKGDRLFLFVLYIVLTLAAAAVVYPVILVVSSSFSSSDAVISGRVWLLPVEPTLDGYRAVFAHDPVWIGYGNSLIYAVCGTVLNVTVTILAAYPLSRRDFFGRNVVTFLFVFTMLFSGGLIPTYLLVSSLGLLDTRLAMIVPNALGVFTVIITRTFFQHTIPQDLLEASKLDGCSDFRFARSIVVPLSGPVVAVISLWYAVDHWNSYFGALIYLKRASLYPLQIVLRNILVMNEISGGLMADVRLLEMQALKELLKYSLIVVAVVPVLAIYPVVQRYFVKGVMIGAIKG
jgi:putative aldouronate transport system permease protein